MQFKKQLGVRWVSFEGVFLALTHPSSHVKWFNTDMNEH